MKYGSKSNKELTPMANGDNGNKIAAMVPSGSTVSGAAIGVPGSIILCWVLEQLGVHVPGEVGAAIGAVMSAVIGYFFSGGKRADTV